MAKSSMVAVGEALGQLDVVKRFVILKQSGGSGFP
jgi:hypothetical protein